MKNLRGHIRLNPLAPTDELAGPLPEAAKLLGTVTCGTSKPGVLTLLPHSCVDFDRKEYPFTLVYFRHGRWTRLPVRRTLAALHQLGYSIQGNDFVLSTQTPQT
jgi:hypothetical protein